MLYTVYADVLLQRLEQLDIGCHVGHKYMGALCYADDMVLLCPSRKGLQQMIYTCEEFGQEFDVLYNERKTVTTCFSKSRGLEEFTVTLNGENLKCEACVKHLGIHTSWNLKNQKEIAQKRGDFIWRTNHVIAKYSFLTSQAKSYLLNSYCMHMYGCETWDYTESIVDTLFVNWNVAVRKIWDLPKIAHRNILPGLSLIRPMPTLMYKRFINLCKTMQACENENTYLLVQCALKDPRSYINVNMQHISNMCSTKLDSHTLPNAHTLCDPYPYVNGDMNRIEILRELQSCREGQCVIPGFNAKEITELYDYISTCP